MKNKIIVTLLSLVLVFSFAACGETEEPVVDTQTSSETVVEKEDESETVSATETSVEKTEEPVGPAVEDSLTHGDLFEVYSSVLEDAFNVVYIGTEPVSDGLGGLKAEAMYMETDQKDVVGYTFEDINDDGTQELIIGCTNCSTSLYALYTYDNSGIKILGTGGYRETLTIYEQGYFVCEGSSGAAQYSYDIYKMDGTERVLKDFFFTDFKDGNYDEIGYYHNKTGEWDVASSEVLTEQAFAVSSEIGLEALDFSGRFTPLNALKDYYGGTHTGITLDDVTGGYTWMLSRYVIDSKEYSADTNNIVQYMYFTEGNTADFCRIESGKVVLEAKDIEVNEYNNQIHFYFMDDENGYGNTVMLYRFENDDTIMVQRLYYDNGGYHIVNEYYMRTVG